MPMDYSQYQSEIVSDVEQVLADAQCQPILFVGSGFTKRYAGGPNWEQLLTQLADQCPLIEKDFAYYNQKHNGDFKKIGSIFSEIYREWAWTSGKSNFPEGYFSSEASSDIFIKHTISDLLKTLPPEEGKYGSSDLNHEIQALRNIRPHAVITTNYDEVIEPLFPDYERIIGQQIMRKGYLSIGEIFKIHGCRSDPASIVINEADYSRFNEDHKYLSAKLLTYFIEHPLIFIGYSAEDPNIKSILYDVDRMVRADFLLVPNIFILEWDPNITSASYPARDKVISVSSNKNIRIKSISASSFGWVFEAFGQASNLEKVNTKLLRALMARSFDLVRSDIPKKHVEINFQQLEHAIESGESFASLFGVTSLSDPSKFNLEYKYSLTEVGYQLGYPGWHKASDLIKALHKASGFDMKASDNKYHLTIRPGHSVKNIAHKYTDAAVDLLKKFQLGHDYKIDPQCR